jgi:hypothetical protein
MRRGGDKYVQTYWHRCNIKKLIKMEEIKKAIKELAKFKNNKLGMSL